MDMKRVILWTVIAFGIALASHAVPAVFAGDAAPVGADSATALYKEGKVEEAIEAFDKLLAEKPGDPRLKLGKALAQLERARMLKEAKSDGYKIQLKRAYATLKPMGLENYENPDWYLAMAKAFWLNDRSQKAGKAIEKALHYRKGFPEALMLRADIAYDECLNAPPASLNAPPGNNKADCAAAARRAYDAVIGTPDLAPDLRAEGCCKIGDIEGRLLGKPKAAQEWWDKAVAAGQDTRFGRMAKERSAGKP